MLSIRWYMWKWIINDIYKPIAKQLKNTVIPISWIRSFTNEATRTRSRFSSRRWLVVEGKSNGVEFANITCFQEDSSSDHVIFVKKHHFRSKTIQEFTTYLQKCCEDCISLNKAIPAFQIKIFDNECKWMQNKAHELSWKIQNKMLW